MPQKYNVKRYKEFAFQGFPKRVYSDIPEEAHNALKELAHENGLPMSAMLGLLIADATEGRYKVSKRKPTPKRTVKKSTTKRKSRGKKSKR